MSEEGQQDSGQEASENITTIQNDDAADAQGSPNSPFRSDPANRKKDAAPTQAPTVAEKKKYQLKVNGQDKELELDEKSLTAYLQKGLAADQRLEELTKSKRELQRREAELEDFYEQMEKDPRGTLKKHPRLSKLDLRSISEQELLEHLERESMDPRDLKIKEYEAKLKEREDKDAYEKEQRERKEYQEKLQGITLERKNAIAKSISTILNNPESTLPHDPRVVGRIAQYMQYCIKNEIPFTQDQIIQKVSKDFDQDYQVFFAKANPKRIYDMMGPAKFKELALYHNQLLQGTKAQPKPAPQLNKPGQKKKYKTIEERNQEEFGSAYVFPDEY